MYVKDALVDESCRIDIKCPRSVDTKGVSTSLQSTLYVSAGVTTDFDVGWDGLVRWAHRFSRSRKDLAARPL